MGRLGVPPEKVQVLLGLLAAGMNPLQASKAAGVSRSFAYVVDRDASGGVSRLAAKLRAAAARGEAGRAAARATGRDGRREGARERGPRNESAAAPGETQRICVSAHDYDLSGGQLRSVRSWYDQRRDAPGGYAPVLPDVPAGVLRRELRD
jgi:hypothetical protein